MVKEGKRGERREKVMKEEKNTAAHAQVWD